MLWTIVGVLSLASGSGGRRTDFYVPSVFDATVQKGGPVASSFFNPEPPELTFSDHLSELKKAFEVMRMGSEKKSFEFILVTLRLLGIDSRKVKDIAFDGFISLVHLLGQMLLKDGGSNRTGRTGTGPKDFSFFHFVLRQPQTSNLLKKMRDPMLADSLLKESAGKVQDDTDCIRLLLCKTGPFVRGMQRSLEFFLKHQEGTPASSENGTCLGSREEEICHGGGEEAAWEKASLEDKMYFFFPPLEEVAAHGDNCDQLFPNCEY